jgi:hypothetical protein
MFVPPAKEQEDDDEFGFSSQVGVRSLQAILGSDGNDEAMGEATDDVFPLPLDASMLVSHTTSGQDALRCSTLSGVGSSSSLLTPRGANRGSIFGGALRVRTPGQVRVASSADMLRTAS